MRTIYLDNAATTPVSEEVRAAMAPWLFEEYGNPSSRHRAGVRAAEALDAARRELAAAVGAQPAGVVFTSGGTESNNLAVLGLARARERRGHHLLLGATEHPSVSAPARALAAEGFEVEVLASTGAGELDLERVGAQLRPDTVLVAQMLVNNEFGAVYPVARLARLVRAGAPEAALHVDAVQGLGKLEVSLLGLGAHSLALSAHKVHGPKGAGALVLAEGVRPRPLVHGGEQEGGLRSGTEHVAGIVGCATAVRRAAEGWREHARTLADRKRRFREGAARLAGVRALEAGGAEGASPAILALRLPGPPAEVWMHQLEARGVLTSVGSACQARKGAVSPALLALGLGEADARQVLRVSFSTRTSAEDVQAALEQLAETHQELAAFAPRR